MASLTVSMRDKINIYDALISSKLSYGLHILPIGEDLVQKLDVFHYKDSGVILKVPTTLVD